MSVNYAISTPNVYKLISGTSSATDFVNQLIAVFTSAGWTVHATITGGKTLLGTSPQGYIVYLDLQVSGSFACFTLHSAVGSPATGYTHLLGWASTNTWQVIVHPCGWFICIPGVLDSVNGSATCGGIPSVAANCGLGTAQGTVTEIWFSFGDYVGSPFKAANNPRIGIDISGQNNTGNQTGCLNGVMALSTADPSSWDVPQILRWSSAAPDGVTSSHPLFYGETDLIYPPFLAWPLAHGDPILIRGQLYNAAVRSATAAGEATKNFDGHNWISYSSGYFWGSLWVLRDSGSAPQFGNVFY